jgi:hypothetical protein
MHLKPEELVDLAEGAAADAAFPHLAACAACRQQLAELRAAMAEVGGVGVGDVPEPPPFFWDRLQHRVMGAVAAETAQSPLRRWRTKRPPVLIPFSIAAGVAILLFVYGPLRPRSSADAPSVRPIVAPYGGDAARLEPVADALDDDPSLQLVADLAGSLDAGAASDAGLAPAGSADHALTHMSTSELQELKRLLRAELGT